MDAARDTPIDEKREQPDSHAARDDWALVSAVDRTLGPRIDFLTRDAAVRGSTRLELQTQRHRTPGVAGKLRENPATRRRFRFESPLALDRIFLIWNIKPVVAAFSALAEPNRQHIVALLRERERHVSELVEALALNQPSVSKHLKLLREAGLVAIRRDAQRRFYRLRPERFRELDDWLTPYRELWATRLDALERHLDQMDDEA